LTSIRDLQSLETIVQSVRTPVFPGRPLDGRTPPLRDLPNRESSGQLEGADTRNPVHSDNILQKIYGKCLWPGRTIRPTSWEPDRAGNSGPLRRTARIF